ncbi:MAG: hypothetical protein JRD89_02380 [Deltaproteobacteria bacterium]|nr:hypothetical protein [Deltaproteobacteria bacterium]
MFKVTRRLMKAAARVVVGDGPTDGDRALLEQLTADLAEVHEQIQTQSHELEHAKRAASEYFNVIEDLHKQREQWKTMFFQQAVSHQGGQAMLTRVLMTTRRQLRTVCEVLVSRDEEGAQELFERLDKTDAPPVGKAEEFAQAMLELAQGAEPQTDGFAERDRIAAEQADSESPGEASR